MSRSLASRSSVFLVPLVGVLERVGEPFQVLVGELPLGEPLEEIGIDVQIEQVRIELRLVDEIVELGQRLRLDRFVELVAVLAELLGQVFGVFELLVLVEARLGRLAGRLLDLVAEAIEGLERLGRAASLGFLLHLPNLLGEDVGPLLLEELLLAEDLDLLEELLDVGADLQRFLSPGGEPLRKGEARPEKDDRGQEQEPAPPAAPADGDVGDARERDSPRRRAAPPRTS